MKFPKIKAGQWLHPVAKGYRFACCDCNLVHKVDFRIVDGRVQIRGFRDNPQTKALRKGFSVVMWKKLKSGVKIKH